MKWTAAAIVVVFFVFILKSAAGFALTHIKCLDAGIRGKRTEVTCYRSNALRRGLYWTRPDGALVGSCDVQNTVCRPSDRFGRLYRGVVNSPVRSTFVINSFDPAKDAGKWRCEDGEESVPSFCHKTDGTDPVTSINCLYAGVSERESKVTCFIHKPLKHGVDWYRPDSARIGSCNKLHTKCTIQIPWKNQYDIILVSEKQSTLVIKSFDAAVDGGDWSCVDGESASPSWCRKMDPRNCYLECDNGNLQTSTCRCDCLEYWTGVKCGECNLKCEHGGYVPKDHCTCRCNKYWIGKTCDNCGIKCKHGATRNENPCTCDCPAGYFQGDECETCILKCAEGGSLDNSSCSCDCSGQWEGVKCEICNLKCEHGGQVNNKTCSCDCNNKWCGVWCEKCQLECENWGILDNAKCFCDCNGIAIGSQCETCTLKCENGGTLEDGCTCECGDIWTGIKCEKCILECVNGDVQKDSCTCHCVGLWTGDFCDTPIFGPERMTGGIGGGVITGLAIAALLAVAIPVAIIAYKRRKMMKGPDDEKMPINQENNTQKMESLVDDAPMDKEPSYESVAAVGENDKKEVDLPREISKMSNVSKSLLPNATKDNESSYESVAAVGENDK